MVKYLNIDLWDVIQYDYVSHYDSSNLTLTQKIKGLKSQNDYAVNVISNSISKSVVILFGTIKIDSEM